MSEYENKALTIEELKELLIEIEERNTTTLISFEVVDNGWN